jgi:hypothetical protein
MSMRDLFLAGLVPLWLAWPPEAIPPTRVAVLSIALNDLSNQPASPELPARIQLLTTTLRERLAAGCGYHVVPVDSLVEASSPWVTDLQAHVVRVRDTTIVSNRIVELKGLELTPELAARLVERGAAWMADQVSQAVEHSSGDQRPAPRRCPA